MAARKRVRPKAARKRSAATPLASPADECRRVLREALTAEYEAIVQAFVEAAKKGSASHMKMTIELLGKAQADSTRAEGSAKRLLNGLGQEFGS